MTANVIIRLFGNDLTLFQNKPLLLRVCGTGLLKTLWKKEKLLITSNFSFSHCVFYLFGKFSAIFIKFEVVVSKLFEGPTWLSGKVFDS